MAKSNTKLTKKAKALLRNDVVLAFVAVSVILNLVMFSAYIAAVTTNSLDLSIYRAAEKQLCYTNYAQNITDEMDESDDPALAAALFEVTCRSGDFERYYDNAVQAYLNETL